MVLHIMLDRADSVIQMFHLHHRTLHLRDLVLQHDLFRPLLLQNRHILIDTETEHDSPKQHKRRHWDDEIQRRIFFIQQYRGAVRNGDQQQAHKHRNQRACHRGKQIE